LIKKVNYRNAQFLIWQQSFFRVMVDVKRGKTMVFKVND